jgi:hypothetical protein
MSSIGTSLPQAQFVHTSGSTGQVNQEAARTYKDASGNYVFETGSKEGEAKQWGIKVVTNTNGTVNLIDKSKPDEYISVWGDPHVDHVAADGTKTRIADVKEDFTLEFAGSKIELKMAPSPDGKTTYVDKLIATNGPVTAMITGAAPDKVNTDKFQMKTWTNGEQIEQQFADGFTVFQNLKSDTLSLLAARPSDGKTVGVNQNIVNQLESQQRALKQTAGAEELAKANGLSQKAADALKTVMGDRTVEDVLGKDVDYSKMSWSSALFHVLGKLLDKTGAEIKKKATELGQAESAKPEEGKEGDKAAEGKDGAKTEAKTDSTKIESAKVELNRLYEQMKSLGQFVQATANIVGDINGKILPQGR